MFPVILQTPWFTIYSYGVFLALAYMVAIELAVRKADRAGIDPLAFSNFILVAVLACFGGARLLYVFVEWPKFAASPGRILALWEGGLVFYGGLIGCLAVMIPWVLWMRMSVVAISDLVMPGLALAQAVGRIGCIGVGCCYGAVTTLPWGMPMGGRYVHPAPLYEALVLFVLWLVLERIWAAHRDTRPGLTTIVYLFVQGIERFLVETIRDDPRGGTFHFGLTISQEIAFGLVVAALGLYAYAAVKVWPGRTAAPAPGA